MRVNRAIPFIICGIIVLVVFGLAFAQENVEQPLAPELETMAEAVDAQQAPVVGKSMLNALELKDMDINDVLKLLAQKSGLNIIAGKSVTGRVTIFLQNVAVRDALTIILKANGLAYIESHGVIQIVTATEYEQMVGRKFGVLTKQETIHLQSIKATDAATLLNQVKGPEGKIVADEQSNTILIEDVSDKLDYLREYVRRIDVLTETRVYKLEYSQAEEVAGKLTEMLSPKIGKTKFDASSNKLFVTDTPGRLREIEKVVKQIDVPRDTKVFDISYAKAENIAKSISPMLTKDIGRAEFDARSNTVIVTDVLPKIHQMKEIIAALDKSEKEVLIDARIIEIGLSDANKMGVDWEAIVSKYQNLTFDNSQFGLGDTSATPARSTVSVGTLSEDNYQATIEFIKTMGKTRVLSNPRIAVINNQEARILVGTTQPYVTTTTTTTASGPGTTAETVNFIDVGVKLHVTPTIHDDGYITMKIKPEVSTATEFLPTSQNNKIPIVNTSEVETVVSVKNGVTIIIGGLIKDELVDTVNKVPGLGDIPMLGKAFRHDEKSIVKKEIVIFLTPHIISGDVHLDPNTYEATPKP